MVNVGVVFLVCVFFLSQSCHWKSAEQFPIKNILTYNTERISEVIAILLCGPSVLKPFSF